MRPNGRKMVKTSLSKGAQTKQFVIEQAAALFNQRGYEAASVSELMEATGLQKGGIYRHFESKQELALAAFEYAVAQMGERFRLELEKRTSPLEKLRGIIYVYSQIPADPPVPGGCPVLNASVEADDGDPELLGAARRAMDRLRKLIVSLAAEAQECGELRADLDPSEVAEVLVAGVEGAVMLSKLYASDAPMRQMVRHLEGWLHA